MPTFVFGRGALLAKKSASVGDKISVYHQQEQQQQQPGSEKKQLEEEEEAESIAGKEPAPNLATAKPEGAVSILLNDSVGSSGEAILSASFCRVGT